ncbi:sphingomyelin phosphodiesterase-like [Cotesia glomerata]|nr:sphingomyelin phosphodiesterase-like [Cotesia glomerata]
MDVNRSSIFLSILVVFVLSCDQSEISINELNETTVFNEIINWTKNGIQTPLFRDIISYLVTPSEARQLDWSKLNSSKAGIFCVICKSLTKFFLALRRNGTSVEEIQNSAGNVCTLLNFQTETVCHGLIRLNLPIILYIIDNEQSITQDDICGILLQNQECSDLSKKFDWTIDINDDPPLVFDIYSTEKKLKILQITDIHYDPLYQPSGNADCDEPTCCRRGQNTNGKINEKSAGFWGDYNNCDLPWHSIVDALEHIKTQHLTFDFVYFTGDIIDHGIWETSQQRNIESIKKCFTIIKNTFGDIPVYPIFGNHESHPLNLYSPDYIKNDSLSTEWLYELMADIWIEAGWLPPSVKDTILKGGYYNVSPRPGFRIISLNSNVCYIYNWWLFYDPQDPGGQLQWLADNLLIAEKNKEIVHILSHIPPGSTECQHTWSREYKKIINRFSHVIAAQFNGHTHNDEFNLFYNPNDSDQVINIAWNGGSLTPYANLNPNYKVYEADNNSYVVQDIETWMYNLTEANENFLKRPNWFKSYSFKEAYNLEDLSKNSLNQLVNKMIKYSSILQTYHKNFFKHAAPSLKNECDNDCLKEYICRIVRSSSDDKSECNNLLQFI